MKICSLLPSGTEILFALGLGDKVIGVSDLCDFPPECLDKHVVSRSKIDATVLSSDEVEKLMQSLLASGENPYDLDDDWITRHSPDVVLTQDLCFFCEVDANQVQQAVVGMPDQPEVVVLQPKTLDGIFHSILQIGDACDASSEASILVADLRSRVLRITNRIEGNHRLPKVFSLEGINPIVTGGHWIPDMLRLAGGRQEMFLPGCPAARPSWDDICAWAPEKLYIDLCSSDLARNIREIPWLAAQDGWAAIPAVQTGEVYLLDHVCFSRPGPRIVQGLEILAQLTHPDEFDNLIPQNTVVKLNPNKAAELPPEQISDCFLPFP